MRGGGAGRLHHRIRACNGMVSAEMAVAILAALPLMVGVVMVVGSAALQVQVMEAARTAARMVARGDEAPVVQEHVVASLPHAQVRIEQSGTDVVVTVAQVVDIGGVVPPFTVSGRAVTPDETP